LRLLGGCCRSGAVFEKRGELRGIAGGRKAGLPRADNGERFVSREMRQSFFKSAGKMGKGDAGRDSQNGLAETEDTMGYGFERLGGKIVSTAGDDNLQRVMREE